MRPRRIDRRTHRVAPGTVVVLTGPGEVAVGAALKGLAVREVIHAGFAGATSKHIDAGTVVAVDRIRRASRIVDVEPTARRRLLDDVRGVTAVTVPRPLSRDDKAIIATHGSADVCDMESYHVHAWCVERGIPYTGVRAITDALDTEIPTEVRDAFDGLRFRTAPLALAAIASPSLLQALLDLRAASKSAGTRLADVLVRCLVGSGPAS